MEKKIVRNMLLLTIICVVGATVGFAAMVTERSDNREEAELKNRAIAYAKALNYFEQDYSFISKPELTAGNIRITVIAPDGEVLYDTVDENLSAFDNHADRPEVAEALSSVTGHGKSRRYSSTLAQSTFYHAVRLDSGDILRLSKTTESMLFTVANILPLMLLVIAGSFIISLLLAGRLTQRIIKPLNEIDFVNNVELSTETETFEELSAFMRKIKAQENQIKEQYSELRDKANTISAIITNMQEGILLLDENGNIIIANKSAARFINNDRFYAAYQDQNISKFIRNTEFLDCVKKAFSGERCSFCESGNGKKANKNRSVEIFFSPVENDGKVGGLIILFLDVTEKVNAEKMRREFSANVSHELKTPLTTILGTTEMINEGMVKSEDIGGFISTIRVEATRLLRLIEDIIKLSELDEGFKSDEAEEFDLGVLAGEIVQRLSVVAAEKNVSVTLEGGGIIKAEKSLIDEMLYNLIDNGIKYNKDGGKVNVSVSTNEIVVSDTGIGIEPEHLDRIFERFYRADKSRSKETGGTGLGLSIVKHIAEYHGGSASIESEPGKGTKVMVRI